MKSFKKISRQIFCALSIFCFVLSTGANASETDDLLQKLIEVGRLQKCVNLTSTDQTNSIASQIYLAILQFMLGHYREAISAINKVFPYAKEDISAEVPKVDALALRGVCYYKLGQYDKALADFTQAMKIPGCPPGVAQSRALVYDKLGDHEKALADKNIGGTGVPVIPFQDGLETARLQSYGVPLEEVAASSKFSGKGNLDKWQQAIELAKEANKLEDSNQLDKAIDKYKAAVEYYSYDPGLYAALGLCYTTRKADGDRDNAIAAFKQALGLDASNWKLWSDLGSILYNSTGLQQTREERNAQQAEAKHAFQMALSTGKGLEPTQKADLLECLRIVGSIPKLSHQLRELELSGDLKFSNGTPPNLNSSPNFQQTPNGSYISPGPFR